MKKILFLVIALLAIAPIMILSNDNKYDFPDDMPEIEDMERFKQCLCWESCNVTSYCGTISCLYAPEPSDESPNCADLSNGPCKCVGFGCSRVQMVTEGEIYEKCLAKYGPMIIGDGKCETNKGENCYISPDDCACGENEICDPVLARSADGCYEIGTNPCSDGAIVSTETGKCECEDADL